ncbi:MAG: hypothetical protein NTX28_12770, partial [Novosphingobium sp.]|nr:hypothetical protein [Novosphingobium sp.]
MAVPTRVINLATSTTVTQTNPPPFLLVENRAGASLDTITLTNLGVPINQPLTVLPRIGAVLVNGGTVEGDVILRGGTYIAAGGTVTGKVATFNPLATTTEYFINRAGDDLGVAGVIDPGNGLDLFVRSYSQSADIQLPAALPTNFELRGIEVLGTGTTLTVNNPAGSSAVSGLAVTGDGAIVNRAVIDNISFAGTGIPAASLAGIRTRAVNYGVQAGNTGLLTFARFVFSGNGSQSLAVALSASIGSALSSFVNEGTINGDIGLNTASFVNAGTVNLLSNQQGTLIQGAADSGLNFINRGVITMTGNGLRTPGTILSAAVTASTALDGTVGRPLSFLNDTGALISGGVALGGNASTLRFENRGEINGDGNPNQANQFDSAVNISWSDFGILPVGIDNFASQSVELINSGTIDGGIRADGAARAVSFVNTGAITSAGTNARAVELGVSSTADANGNYIVDGETFSFDNKGTIQGSSEIELEVSSATITNSGQISAPATQGLTIYPGGQQGLLIEQETVLGSTLSFTNSGTIESADAAGAAVLIGVEAGDLDSGLPAAAQASAVVNITNSGTLRTTGGAFVVPGP